MRKTSKFWSIIGLGLASIAMVFAALGGVASMGNAVETRAEDVVYKTAKFGASYNSKKISSYTDPWSSTYEGFTVNLANFNNNNNDWSFIKCGRKNNASVATLITNAAIDKAVTKVTITIDALTASNINSVKLYSSNDSASWSTEGSFTKATGAQTVTISSPAANKYYKIEFDCASGSSNGLLTLSQVDFYVAQDPTPSTFSVTYDANGATGGDVPTDAGEYESGGTVTVSGNTGSLIKTNYTFNDWNTAADGSGSSYSGGDTFEITANTTLYAQWNTSVVVGLSEDELDIAMGSSETFTVSASGGVQNKVKFTSSVAGIVSLSSGGSAITLGTTEVANGTEVAVAGLKAGTTVLTATSVDVAEVTATCTVTVSFSPEGQKIEYVFTSKSWAATSGGQTANWTSGQDGNAMTSGQGVQVTTGASGANATSPSSITGVSAIEVVYSTNASKGTGDVSIQVGSGTEQSQSVTKTGGTSDRSLYYTFNPNETGSVRLKVTCSDNSIYIKSISIWYIDTTPYVTLDKTEATGFRGQSTTLTATPSNITPVKYVWTTSSAEEARINDSANATVETVTNSVTITYVSDAAATPSIVVYAVDSEDTKSNSDTCTITITASSHSITLSKAGPISVEVGKSDSITPTLTQSGYYSGHSTSIGVVSGTLSVATVSSASVTSGSAVTITGIAVGTSTITFSDVDGATTTLTVKVVPPEKANIDGIYMLCTSVDDLDVSGHYIIGNGTADGSVYFASTAEKANNRGAVSYSVSDQTVALASDTSALVFKLGGTTDSWSFLTKNYVGTNGYLAGVNNQNYLQINSSESTFTISFDNGALVMQSNVSNRFVRYNPNGGTPIFGTYASDEFGGPVYLYKQIDYVEISSITIPEAYGASAPLFYEGQSYTPEITYNEDATLKTSEVVVVSGSQYVDVEGQTITAKAGVISGSSQTVEIKMHATDVEDSEVYSNVCTITITKDTVSGVSVITDPTTTVYVEGQTLNVSGMVVEVTWAHGPATTITAGYTTSPAIGSVLNLSQNGNEVSVTYQGVTSGNGDGFTISVIAKAIVSGGVTISDETTVYSLGDHFVADGSLNVRYNDDTSEDFSVADLFAAGEITFKIGSTVIDETYVFEEEGSVDIKLTYSGRERTFTVKVANIEWAFLTECTASSDIVDNGKYIIAFVYENESTYDTSIMPLSISGHISPETCADSWKDTFDSTVRVMRTDINAYAWTIEALGNSQYGIFNGSDYLSYSSKTNFASQKDTTSDNSKWTISFTDGNPLIDNVGASTSRGVIYRTGTFNEFGAYATSNVNNKDYFRPRLYKVVNFSDDDWEMSDLFAEDLTCDGDGGYQIKTAKESWESLANDFEKLTDLQKSYYRHAAYHVTGAGADTVVSPLFGTNDNVADFVSKYDFILHKYENEGLTDFIGRKGTSVDEYRIGTIPVSGFPGKSNEESPLTTTLWIVLGCGLAGLGAIGTAYFISKKKREQSQI